MKRFAIWIGSVLICASANAQAPVPFAAQGIPQSAKMTTANTYQQILPKVAQLSESLKSVFIQNNNATDSCWIEETGLVTAGMTTSSTVTVNGVSLTAQQASALLAPRDSYNRSFPYVPSGPIVAACANSGDSLYVVTQ